MIKRIDAQQYREAELTDYGNGEGLILNRDFTGLVLESCDLLEQLAMQLVDIALMDSDMELEAIRAKRMCAKLRRMIRDVQAEVDRRDLQSMEIDNRIKLNSWVRNIETGEQWQVDDMDDTDFLKMCVWLRDG